VDLCGHATLATAHVLFNELDRVPADISQLFRPLAGEIAFETRSGVLRVRRIDDAAEAMLQLDFPAGPSEPVSGTDISTETVHQLQEALGLTSVPLEIAISASTRKLLLVTDSVDSVLAVRPQYDRLLRLEFGRLPVRGVIVTARAGHAPYERSDFVSRYFAPWNGIPEDPVTGAFSGVESQLAAIFHSFSSSLLGLLLFRSLPLLLACR
jgi:PhzF family phenazine biosynthesis protein